MGLGFAGYGAAESAARATQAMPQAKLALDRTMSGDSPTLPVTGGSPHETQTNIMRCF